MSDIPSIPKRIQEEETEFEAPVSESTMRKVGGVVNYLLDHYAIPPGASMDFNGLEAAVPSGWHPEDGRALSRTTYANLFAAIGTLHGVGDGLTTFNIPDKRGLFSRMVDRTTVGQKGKDPDHASRTPIGTGTAEDPGSTQTQDLFSHTHGQSAQSGAFGPGPAPQWFSQSSRNFDNQTAATGGNETRPVNIYVYSIIKD